VTLLREDAATSGRYARRLGFGVTVLRCDHSGCREGLLIGIGDGDNLTAEEAAEAIADGWALNVGAAEKDYCPAHAAEHSDADDEDAADEDDE
jgi:hypothetical protein